MFLELDPRKILETTQALAARIAERFPDSGLASVGKDVVYVAKRAAALSFRIRRPMWWLRIGAALFSGGLIAALVLALLTMSVSTSVTNISDLAQGIESSINDVVFAGIAIWFLFSIETRAKRRRALGLIGELRSLAHVIDMHQLTKDPERIGRPAGSADPLAAPQGLTQSEIARYLDYCTELLSILGMLAALPVHRFNDSATLAAVDELQDLTNGLSQKMWQKIMIIDRVGSSAKSGNT